MAEWRRWPRSGCHPPTPSPRWGAHSVSHSATGWRKEIAGPLAGVLDSLSLMESFGDYVFVHAGLRPGRPLQAQSAEDLIWIREGFLGSDADFGAVVIHGHTPTPRLDVKDNRIGIDTGAVFGGPLTCLVLEGRDRWQLTSQGRSSVAR